MRELSDDECMAIAGPECTVLSSFGYELVRAAYAAGYAAAQSGPPREPTDAMCDAGLAYYDGRTGARIVGIAGIWRSMHDAWAQEQTGGETHRASEQANADQAGVAPGPPDHQPAEDDDHD